MKLRVCFTLDLDDDEVDDLLAYADWIGVPDAPTPRRRLGNLLQQEGFSAYAKAQEWLTEQRWTLAEVESEVC